MTRIDLSNFDSRSYHPGRPYWARALWLVFEAFILLNPLFVSYAMKAAVLRLFGARVGEGVVIKPNVHIKYPWRLRLGDHVWIGERAWIDNLADVTIEANVCISQGAYLCTGNHDWSDPRMGLVVKSIAIEEGVWVGAFARIAPGVRLCREAIVTLGSVLQSDAEPQGIYSGNPARRIGQRSIRSEPLGSAALVGKSDPPRSAAGGLDQRL